MTQPTLIPIPVILLLLCLIGLGRLNAQPADTTPLYRQADELMRSHPDSALTLLQLEKNQATKLQQHNRLLNCLLLEGKIYQQQKSMNKALEAYFEAQYLAEKLENKMLTIKCYQSLAGIYLFFFKHKEARKYIEKAHTLSKECIREGIAKPQFLIQSYYELSRLETNKNSQNNTIGLLYIDSCLQTIQAVRNDPTNDNTDTETNYIYTQQALLYYHSGKTDTAEQLLLGLAQTYEQPELMDYQKRILVLVYSHLTQVYKRKKNYQNMIKYANLSLAAIEKFKTHNGQKEFLHTQLSEAYEGLADFESAYLHLWKARVLRNQLFGARNNRNKNFFTLHSDYLKKIEKRDKALIQKQLLLADKENTILYFRAAFILLVLLVLVVFLIARIRVQKLQHKNSELLLQQKAKEREKRINQVLELKNKELTSYSLRFLERKDLLIQLSDYIKKHPDGAKSAKLLNALASTTATNWEDFNTRFSSVHEGFYERLQAHCPAISSTELKHCALIKLNFSAKEMSDLLGISAHSINVSRYRIRQKLELERQVNLNKFIAQI